MRALWKLANRLTGQKPFTAKRRCFLLLSCTASGLAGLAVWMIVHCFTLNSPEWMICFIGYPAMFGGFFGGVIYIMNVNDRTEE